jgi:acyl-CoA reductase-like NAD-dependent aldehyde dehydrogenase
MQAAARSNLKDISLELGGKSPLVVFDDANLELAAKEAVTSITLSESTFYEICW